MNSKPRTRNRFHADFKLACALNLVDRMELMKFSKSTRSSLLNTSPEHFNDLIGLDRSSSFDFSNPDIPEKLDIIKQFAKCNTAIILFKDALMIYNTIVSVFITYGFYNLKSIDVKRKIVNAIIRVKNIVGFERAIRYFKITKSTFYNWQKQIAYKCSDSASGLCLKYFPSQLAKTELDAFRQVLADKLKLFWSYASIWGYAFFHNIISFSYSTFLRYIKLLKLSGHTIYKKLRKPGLMATAINQFWHADVTIYKLLNGIKVYIYLLSDNYSNLILSHQVSATLLASIRKDTVEEAYTKYGNCNPNIIYSDVFPILNADLTIENYYTHLLTDGGSENKGELDDYLTDPDVKIRKLIALKDIDYSNSAIEALNKIVKYQELHLKDLPDLESVRSSLDKWVPVYNNERPNRKGNYLLTPLEIYNGKVIDKSSIKNRIANARTERIAYNRTHSCGKC